MLAFSSGWKEGLALAVHNLSSRPATVKLSIKSEEAEHLVEYFSDRKYKVKLGVKTKTIDVGAYGYRWFRKSILFA